MKKEYWSIHARIIQLKHEKMQNGLTRSMENNYKINKPQLVYITTLSGVSVFLNIL